jgi:hypothetical protein
MTIDRSAENSVCISVSSADQNQWLLLIKFTRRHHLVIGLDADYMVDVQQIRRRQEHEIFLWSNEPRQELALAVLLLHKCMFHVTLCGYSRHNY